MENTAIAVSMAVPTTDAVIIMARVVVEIELDCACVAPELASPYHFTLVDALNIKWILTG